MRHWRARRRLAALLDGSLAPRRARAVREHARGCAACGRRLREHEAVEELLRLLPHALVPYEPSPRADVRLWGLARWFVDPAALWRERVGLGAVGFGVALMAFVASAALSGWDPVGGGPAPVLTLAQAVPDAASMLPLGWR